MPVMIAEVSG